MGSDFRATLLGTGVPTPRPDRFGPCTLIEAGDQKLLIDAGRGATIRLYQIGVPNGQIDALFLTHYHSDHTVGIPDLWLTGWLQSRFATRRAPFRVIGPVGANTLMSHLEKAYTLDINIRIEDEKLPPESAAILVEEFDNDGIVYEKNGVRVIAFEVDHGDVIKPAYGYRIEYGGRAVVISGDTRYNDNVVKYGAGADLLIHEVAIVRPELAPRNHVLQVARTSGSARYLCIVWPFYLWVQNQGHLFFAGDKSLPSATPAAPARARGRDDLAIATSRQGRLISSLGENSVLGSSGLHSGSSEFRDIEPHPVQSGLVQAPAVLRCACPRRPKV